MFGTRSLTEYSESKLAEPEPILIHKTFDPLEEKKSRVRFDIRSVAGATHMSSTIFIERKIRAKAIMPSKFPERYTMGDMWGTTSPRQFHGMSENDLVEFLRKPGFLLQENLKRVNFSFNGGDIFSDTSWLAPYAKLYENSMLPYIRSSGKTFSNQNDHITRVSAKMGDNADIRSVVDGVVTQRATLSSPYVHPERNDRREKMISGVNLENVVDGYSRVPWFHLGAAGEYANTQITGYMGSDPNFTDDDRKNNGLYDVSLFRPARPGPDAEQTQANKFNYQNGGHADQTLNAGKAVTSAEFTTFYETYWKTEDDLKYNTFIAARDALFVGGTLLEHGNVDQWNAMKALFATVFQTHDEAQAKPGGADGTWEDTLGHWGVDLRRPCYSYAQLNGENSQKQLLMKTSAAMLQFVDELQRWHQYGLANQANVQNIIKMRIRKEELENAKRDNTPDDHGIVNPGPAFRFDVVQKAINDEEKLDEEDQDEVAIASWEATLTALRVELDDLDIPTDHEPDDSWDAESDEFNTIVQQIDNMIEEIDAEIETEKIAFRTANQAYRSWNFADQEQHRNYIGAMQWLSRWVHWYSEDWNKEAKTNRLKSTCKYISATIVEPCMIGPCKPSEYANFGCYANNSSVIPYIDRFRVDLVFKDDAKYFELDAYSSKYEDVVVGEVFYPSLKIETTETKLHCVFVEKPIALPATLPYLDVRTERIGTITLAKDVTEGVTFQNIDIRRAWKYLMVYCKLRKPREYHIGDPELRFIESDKGAAIVNATISTDIQQNCLVASNRERVNAMTLRNFPEYIAPVGKTGGVLAVVFNEFPQRKAVAEGWNHIYGEVHAEQDWSDKEIEVDVFLSFFRTDVLLEINEDFVKSNIHLTN